MKWRNGRTRVEHTQEEVLPGKRSAIIAVRIEGHGNRVHYGVFVRPLKTALRSHPNWYFACDTPDIRNAPVSACKESPDAVTCFLCLVKKDTFRLLADLAGPV